MSIPTEERKTTSSSSSSSSSSVPSEQYAALGAMIAKQFLNKSTSDIDITFAEAKDVRYPGHKMVLNLISPVFAKLVSERKDEKDPIIIRDLKPDAFKLMLQWIYTGKCEAKAEECPPLITAATAYGLPQFGEYIGARLAAGMDISNACEIFEKAPSAACLKYVAANLGRIVAEPSWVTLSKDRLTQILLSDDLDLAEGDIFKAVCRWGETEAKKKGKDGTDHAVLRGVLADLIPLIRFPLMQLADLTTDARVRGILEESKLTQMCTYVSISDEKVRAALPCDFNKKPRKFDAKKKAAAVVKYLGLDKLVGGFFGLR